MIHTLLLVATIYAHSYTGKIMSNGLPYDPGALTAANNTLPLGSVVRVCRAVNNSKNTIRNVTVCVNVTITDRMNERFPNRIDLSEAAAKQIGVTGKSGVRVYTK